MRSVIAPGGLTGSVVVLGMLALGTAPVLANNHPFASHPFAYAAGSIQPNHASQAILDQAVRDFYDAWKARYLVQTCGTGRYVVAANTEPGNLTVSEAHGYGMMIMAFMAGHDPDARTIFDGMYAYFREHPTAFHDQLMSFYQKNSCADANGNDSATDGDIDIAFALLLADKQWGSCGGVDYGAEALAVLTDIEDGEIDASGRYTLLGDWVDSGDAQYYPATRSSDFMPDHLRAFATTTGDAVWTDVLDHTYQVFDTLQASHSPTTGLLPDFIVNPLGTAQPAPAEFLEGPNDGAYDYNACRDPWRIGTDFLVSGDSRAKTVVQRITTWFRSATGDDPEAIKSGYQLSGALSPDADYRSMAFVAPLGVGAMVDASNQAWLNDLWDLVVATPIEAEGYYENTLKLLAMLTMSGNWWAPTAVSGGCVAAGTPLCQDGGSIGDLDIKIGGLPSGAGKQTLKIKGKLFVPQGIPATSPYTDGAQILVEDAGNGNAAVFDVSRFTIPVPPAAQGTCDPADDGWNAKASRTLYRNRSTALDPPTCTPGSARGLSRIKYKPRGERDLDFQVKAKRATIAAPVGPLRVTLVLGSTQAASEAGACGVSIVVPCTAGGTVIRCR